MYNILCCLPAPPHKILDSMLGVDGGRGNAYIEIAEVMLVAPIGPRQPEAGEFRRARY